jgi:intracellular multiplication protein IcmP
MSSNSQNNADQGLTLVLGLALLFLAFWLVWHFFKMPILEALRWIRFAELWVINLFFHRYDSCLDWLREVRFADPDPSPTVVRLTNQCFGADYLANVPVEDSASYYSLSANGIGAIESGITQYIHWPLAAVFAGLGFYTMFYSPRNKFRTKHTLESFIKVQAKMWPVISPIVDFNPIKSSARIPGSMVPDKLPLFAEALSPEEWISYQRIPVTNNIPEREATRRAFLLQLGPRWNGLAGQPPYILSLFAAFALKGIQNREESDDLLGRLSQCWSAKAGFKLTPNIASEVAGLVRNSDIGGQALAVAEKHAYRTTAMLGVLGWARSKGGVLAPAQFLWLRGVDRTLWYALNNLGRRSFHTEGAGAMAHFMAEQNANKPLPIPRIDTAVVTMNQYLAERGLAIPPREGASR